ncbi:MAG: STAS domain-containing protein [Selenomonadaceae bacterium]|nr:STAS domain-containing protein [Selenomonadaceae bacterium]
MLRFVEKFIFGSSGNYKNRLKANKKFFHEGMRFMEIKKILDGSNLTVALIGRLDAVTAIELDKNLVKQISDIENLTLDLKELDYIASAGLRILLKLKIIMDSQGTLKVINVNTTVREVMDMTGFSDLLLPDEEKKFAGFSAEF